MISFNLKIQPGVVHFGPKKEITGDCLEQMKRDNVVLGWSGPDCN